MSAYANDSRVQRNRTSDETFDVETAIGWWIVLHKDGGWFAERYRNGVDDKGPFASADDAIRSLIGDPR